MADAEDLKSSEGSLLWVQVPLAPQKKRRKHSFAFNNAHTMK